MTGAQQSFLPSQYPPNGFMPGAAFMNGSQQPVAANVRRGFPSLEQHASRGQDAQSRNPGSYPQLLPSLLDSSSGPVQPLLGLKLKKSPSALEWFQQQLDQQQGGQAQQPPVLQHQLPVQLPILQSLPQSVPAVAGTLQPPAPLPASPLPTHEPHSSWSNNNMSMGTSFEEALEGMDFTSSVSNTSTSHFLSDSAADTSPDVDDWTAMMVDPLCEDDLAVVQSAAVNRRSASLGHDPQLPAQGGISKHVRTSPFGSVVSAGGAAHRRSFS